MSRWRARLLFSVRNSDAFMRTGSLKGDTREETRSNFNTASHREDEERVEKRKTNRRRTEKRPLAIDPRPLVQRRYRRR